MMICIYQRKDKDGKPQWETQIGIPKRNIQESPNPGIKDVAKRKTLKKKNCCQILVGDM